MELREIKDFIETLNEDGTPKKPGYCFKNYFIYNKENIHCNEERLKEWEFYQFREGDYFIQLTFGHASIFDDFAFNLVNTKTGKKYLFDKMKLHKKGEFVYPNTELDHVLFYTSKNCTIKFSNTNGNRTIEFKGYNKHFKNIECKIDIKNDLNNEKMVILTPFKESKYQFYLNYKENYYKCKAAIKIDNEEFYFNNLKGLIDSGRGYWPYTQEWVWSSMTANINEHDFGWNIGWGFGNLEYASENMIFFDHKGIQLGHLDVDIDYENIATSKVHLKDKNGLFEATLVPVYDFYTHINVIYIKKSCHQVHYDAHGYIKIDGKKYEFRDIRCFLEHAINRW